MDEGLCEKVYATEKRVARQGWESRGALPSTALALSKPVVLSSAKKVRRRRVVEVEVEVDVVGEGEAKVEGITKVRGSVVRSCTRRGQHDPPEDTSALTPNLLNSLFHTAEN